MLELKQLATRAGVGEELVRHRFLQSMGENLRPILATQKTLTLDQLAALADELSTLTPVSANINAVKSSPVSQKDESHFSGGNHARQMQTSIPFGLRPFRPNQRPRVCRGHLYYGENSRTCKKWCRWPNKSEDLKIEASSRPPSRTSSPSPAGNGHRD
jgi:hypothetical protein